MDKINNLQIVWNNILCEQNEEKKAHWVTVFLYEFNNCISLEQTTSVNSYLLLASSELSCYMIQAIYNIVSSSIISDLNQSSSSNTTINCNQQQFEKDRHLKCDQNLYYIPQIVIQNCNDITTTAKSLRIFLTQGLGARLLEFLSIGDLKLITCKRELASLLINLFPSTTWDEINMVKSFQKNVFFENSFENYLYEVVSKCLPFGKKEYKIPKEGSFPVDETIPQSSNSINNDEKRTITEIEIDWENFVAFQKKQRTSDEIAAILIDLLIKLTDDEHDTILNKKSITVECIQFALNTLPKIEDSMVFKKVNQKFLKLKFFSLIISSYNNIFCDKIYDKLLDIKTIFEELVPNAIQFSETELNQISESNGTDFNICIFAIIFALYHKYLSLPNRQVNKYFDIIDIFKINNIKENLIYIIKLDTEMNCVNYCKLIVDVLFKIINLLRVINFSRFKKFKKKQKELNNLNGHNTYHHIRYNNSCYFENILLDIFNYLDNGQKRIVIKYFRKNGICCCLCNIQTLNNLFKSTSYFGYALIYDLVKNIIIKTIFSRANCTSCLNKSKSLEFHQDLFNLYKMKNDLIINTDELIKFLKHILKVSFQIKFNLSSKFLYDIVLENLHHEISKGNVNLNINVILTCLYVLINNLKDTRLIKYFFTEENVKHLEDFIYVPELSNAVCNLIKIGLEHSSNLCDSMENYLIGIQLKSLSSITEIIIDIVKSSTTCSKFETIQNKINVLQKKLHLTENFTSEIFSLAAEYWEFTLRFYKSNIQYKNKFPYTYLDWNISSDCDKHAEAENPEHTHKCSVEILKENALLFLSYHSLQFFLNVTTKNKHTRLNDYASTSSDSQMHLHTLLNEYELPVGNLISVYKYWWNVDHTNSDNKFNIALNINHRPQSILTIEDPYESGAIDSLSWNFELNTLPEEKKKFYKCSFLKKLESFNNQSLIYDLRNSTNSCVLSDIDLNSFTCTQIFEHSNIACEVQRKLFNSSAKNSNNNNGNNLSETDDKLKIFLDTFGDYRKYLLKIFECTLATWILEAERTQINDQTMSSSLKILQNLLSSNSVKYWENVEYANLIMQALQSLLRVAEISSENVFLYNSKQRKSKNFKKDSTEQFLNVSISSDNDFHSAKMSCSEQFESDIEPSETDTEEFYITADEGYEGDAEVQNPSISDADYAEMLCSLEPSSRYRMRFMHKGVCKIVIEILMLLSVRCIQDINFWSAKLSELANRLYIIKDSLGGSLYLIKGFQPILENGNYQLRDFQQSILDLITDFNKPEIISAYMKLLASESPPIDLLIRFFVKSCTSSIKVQPTCELVYPMLTEETAESGSFHHHLDELKEIYNNHQLHDLYTPFIEAATIIPINNLQFQPWNEKGFNISMWLHINEIGFNPLKLSAENNSTNIFDNYITQAKTHLVSIGSGDFLISFYISNELNLILETSRPNAYLNDQQNTNSSVMTCCEQSGSSSCRALPCSLFRRKRKYKNNLTPDIENIPLQTRVSSPNTRFEFSLPSTYRSKLANAIEHTKDVLRNSIYQKQNNPTCVSNEPGEDLSIKIDDIQLSQSGWHHLNIGVEVKNASCCITLTLDATDQTIMTLPHLKRFHTLTNEKTQLLCIGTTYSSDQVDDSETVINIPMSYSISNLMLFEKSFSNKGVLANLVALGPDCYNITQCQIGNLVPNYGFLDINKISRIVTENFKESLRDLRSNLILVYTAHKPNIALGFTKNEIHQNIGEKLQLITFGAKVLSKKINSIQTAIFLCGGLSSLLYLFARTVELTSDPDIQASTLDLLLHIAHSDSKLYTEFIRNNYFALIGSVIRTEQCSKDVRLLRTIINVACNKQIVIKRNENIQIVENTNACIIYPILIVNLIKRYSDWIKSTTKESEVLETLLRCVQALIRDKHPYQSFNLTQLSRTGFVKELFNFIKIYVIESTNPAYISNQAAEIFINLLSIFAGAPPTPSLLDEILKLLLLLQKPSSCFITHDRSKFYFLINPNRIYKTKKISLPLPSQQMRQNFHERKKNALSTNDIRESITQKDHQSSAEPISYASTSNYTYNRDNVKSLDSIIDCSKLSDRNAVNLLDSNESAKLYKSLINLKIRQQREQQVKLRSKKICRRRYKTPLTLYNYTRTSKGKHIKYANDIEKFMKEYEIVDFDDVSTLKGLPFTNVLRLKRSHIKNSFSSGVTKIQKGLFMLLKDFLLILPDSSIDEVLTHYVKLEIILVLANHENADVRSAIVQLISVLCNRLASNEIQSATKKLYWYHLGNQLAQYPADENLIEACMHWITGTNFNFEQLKHCEEIKIRTKLGLNALIAIIPTTVINEGLALNTLAVIKIIYIQDVQSNAFMIECGLIQSLLKMLYKCSEHIQSSCHSIIKAVTSLLITIANKSLISSGNITVLWDILNVLAYKKCINLFSTIQMLRVVQANIFISLINEFQPYLKIPSEINNFKIKELRLQNSNLSPIEIKTRFELLLDRCVQFITSVEISYILTFEDIQLFEILVSFAISGMQRCSNVIAWGLLPTHPISIKTFVINNLWLLFGTQQYSKDIFCDAKIVKSLLWSCLVKDVDSFTSKEYNTLSNLCKYLGVTHSDSWNIKSFIDKLEINRQDIIKDQEAPIEKTIGKFEKLAQGCIESSMIITRIVTELQNSERKILISHMRQHDESYIYRDWLSIIHHMTNEGSVWFTERNYPKSWELDDTEGPSRVRARLKRCNLNINDKFLLEGSKQKCAKVSYRTTPLHYLTNMFERQLNCSLSSQVLFNFAAKHVQSSGEIDGELVLTENQLLFVATHKCKLYCISCDISNITEIWLRRYQHNDNAFEIFMTSNRSLLFALQRQDDRKIIKEIFSDKVLHCPEQSKIILLSQQWREGQLTNWEYLMALNQLAGRTYNDLMQYPVFPWILTDYTSHCLDLHNKQSFRNLQKPIAIQNENNELHYINNYNDLTMPNFGSLKLHPYHYSSHYSNSGTVLHFLIRVPPFTNYFIRYQDNKFDMPDRTFHSIKTTWSLASNDSPTDVKELIPEFFCFPEIFENFEEFDFGVRQNGQAVNHVDLPPWCKNNPRLFVLIHRQALESEIVRKHLHNWIDLIFGYKQTGTAAIEAINVFHPATYAEFITMDVADPIERRAFDTMIKTYGQMPKQLFDVPHPASNELSYNDKHENVLNCVKGLRWGNFTGSPQLSGPRLCNIYKQIDIVFGSLVSFSNTNVIYGIPEKSCVMQGLDADTYNIVSWNFEDGLVRTKTLCNSETSWKTLVLNNYQDEITCCGSDPNSNTLWFGHQSGRITVYQVSSYESNKNGQSRHIYKSTKLSYNSAFRKISTKLPVNIEEYDIINNTTKMGEQITANWIGPITLIKHSDEVTSIKLSVEFKISVSVSKDGFAVIWDGNNFNYIRSINQLFEVRPSPIHIVDISPTLGDILTVHSLKNSEQENGNNKEEEGVEVTEESVDDFVNVSMKLNGQSLIRLHSINAKYINHIVLEDKVVCACYSYIKEGSGINVIATGFVNGIVRLWSSWDLSLIREIVATSTEIISLTYSTYHHLVILSKDNYIQVWETDGLYGSSPKFPQIVFQKSNNT